MLSYVNDLLTNIRDFLENPDSEKQLNTCGRIKHVGILESLNEQGVD